MSRDIFTLLNSPSLSCAEVIYGMDGFLAYLVELVEVDRDQGERLGRRRTRPRRRLSVELEGLHEGDAAVGRGRRRRAARVAHVTKSSDFWHLDERSFHSVHYEAVKSLNYL